MAKKKVDVAPIEDEIIEEVVESEPPIEEVKEPTPKKAVDIDAFIERKLRVINEMPNKAKAKAKANRLMRLKESRGNK